MPGTEIVPILERVPDLMVEATPRTVTLATDADAVTFHVLERRVVSAVPERPGTDAPTLLIADRIPQRLHDELAKAGVSWLDRRGHLRLRHRGLFVELDFTPTRRPVRLGRRFDPLAGRALAGVSLLALARYPNPLPSNQQVADQLAISKAGASNATSRLTQAGLLDGRRTATPAMLFEAVATTWQPDWIPLAEVPPPAAGIVAVGRLAAAELDAPVLVPTDAPVELLVAADDRLQELVVDHGLAAGPEVAAALVAVAPAPVAVDPPAVADRPTVAGHPVAATPVVALTVLATHGPRGHEILDDWAADDHPW